MSTVCEIDTASRLIRAGSTPRFVCEAGKLEQKASAWQRARTHKLVPQCHRGAPKKLIRVGKCSVLGWDTLLLTHGEKTIPLYPLYPQGQQSPHPRVPFLASPSPCPVPLLDCSELSDLSTVTGDLVPVGSAAIVCKCPSLCLACLEDCYFDFVGHLVGGGMSDNSE